jgi:hypothetical protein
MALDRLGTDMGKIANLYIVVAVASNVLSLTLSYIQIRKYPVLDKFDQFMSRRFYLCHQTLKYYGVKLFGQDIQMIVNRPIVGKVYHFWLDNAYMSILLRYGPVVLIVFSGLYIWTMIVLKDMKQYMLLEILSLYAIYGIMENNFFSLSQNLFLLLLSYPIYKHLSYNEEQTNRGLLSRIRLTW